MIGFPAQVQYSKWFLFIGVSMFINSKVELSESFKMLLLFCLFLITFIYLGMEKDLSAVALCSGHLLPSVGRMVKLPAECSLHELQASNRVCFFFPLQVASVRKELVESLEDVSDS